MPRKQNTLLEAQKSIECGKESSIMPPRVLVADGDPALRILLNVILSRAGFDVDVASTGHEALRKSMADHYDAIMLDLILPEVNGVQVLEQLKSRKPDSLKKVIVVTGATRPLVDQVDPSSVHAMLRKPFDIAEVIRLTAECVHES